MSAIEVAVLQPMPLPHERQGLCGVQCLATGREISTGVVVVHGMVEADVDAAEAFGQVIEAREIHLGEVVDRLAGQIAHRTDGRFASCFPAGALEFLAVGDALVDQLLLGLRLR